ncbi:MAG: pyridoxamine 5'-phosphate oxidase [Candidatus Dormibacteraeota bacterium]|nr:pyridoxamine 5'-phosphate oxidase [Candidatus Dormibacteraeota bacterium]MBO0703906.1 pyridoxamine 5'-phosphate oxidase [Candidatus Dormibacteraeota bacterium]MBO0762679.1 pyridoxamine 5'-phosphate oxidase [Candidatus Dormibacteraeota bacterium]
MSVLDTDQPLNEADVDPDPIVEFNRWFALAREAGEPQPNAMALATTGVGGAPAVRMVLLYRANQWGFTFFTNYESEKGAELDANPRAALAFHWPLLHRQVRVAGRVTRTTHEESEEYWANRPWGSRIAATASAQSSVLPARTDLERAVHELEARYPEDDGPPLPAFWGGFHVHPEAIEFWQGRINRMHDRLRFVREEAGWKLERLWP